MELSQQPQQETASALMGRIVDEYLERADRGERPKIEEYERRHPELAEVIRKMLPTLQMMHVSAGLDATNDLQPEEQITPEAPLGDFRIIRELGRGGMGVVYEAQQISLGRTVALKVLPFAAAMDEHHLQRFKNEALAAAHLDHPNIVDVYGVGCERGVHFYAMRHIDGQSLATVIEELRGQDDGDQRRAALEDGGNEHSDSTPSSADAMLSTGPIAALSTERTANSRELYRSAARLIKQAADALEHAHQMGVLHRDVKPGNLLLDRRGNLWVTDFGLAQVQSSTQLTMTGDLLGTLRYMSPEQALAKRITVDHRTDVYSLGATLYELLTLQPVFSGRDREELLRQIAFEEPKAPRRKKPSIPVELETIVLRAIAKNPDDRYASAGEMADDLQRFIDDKPIRARRPTLVQHVRAPRTPPSVGCDHHRHLVGTGRHRTDRRHRRHLGPVPQGRPGKRRPGRHGRRSQSGPRPSTAEERRNLRGVGRRTHRTRGVGRGKRTREGEQLFLCSGPGASQRPGRRFCARHDSALGMP